MTRRPLVVFDIDGTLSDATHRVHFVKRNPKDWDAFFNACGLDDPILPVIKIARALFDSQAVDIEFWTGRPEDIRDLTRDWLHDHIGPWAASVPLKMRKTRDFRSDIVAKAEFVGDRKPLAIFEDRPRVVKMFRSMGITVFQVAEEER